MDDLGTILTLLLVVLPMAAGLIEKLLKAAGKTGAAGKMKDLAEMFDSKDSSDDAEQAAGNPHGQQPVPAGVPAGQPAPATAHSAQPAPVMTHSRQAAPKPLHQMQPARPTVEKPVPNVKPKTGSPAADEAVAEKKPFIDKKKLIIYSEILKPKF